MFSAKAQETDKGTGKKVGADDYLTKPSAPADIISHVENLLAKKKGSVTTKEQVSG
jgi:DNA-binding response OmpR family regulator